MREFCITFWRLGIAGHINLNKDSAAIGRDLRSAQFEETVRQLAETRQKEAGHAPMR